MLLFLLKYWKPIAFGLFLLALTAGSYFKGRADANSNCAVKIAAMEAASQKIKDAEAAKAQKAAQSLEQDNANAQVETKARERIITKVVTHTIYARDCWDASGLSIAQSALAGPRSTPAKPDKPLP